MPNTVRLRTPHVVAGRRRFPGGQRGLVAVDVVQAGLRVLLDLPDRHLLLREQLGDLRRTVVHVAGDDGVFRADVHAGGLEADVHPVGAVVALGRRVGVRIDVQGVVGAGLHAALASDAAPRIEIDDAVFACVQRRHRADLHAGGVLAVVAPHDGEVPGRVRIGPLLDVLHPGPVDAEGHLVLGLARDRAGVAPDTLPVVYDETVLHERSGLCGQSDGRPGDPADRQFGGPVAVTWRRGGPVAAIQPERLPYRPP